MNKHELIERTATLLAPLMPDIENVAANVDVTRARKEAIARCVSTAFEIEDEVCRQISERSKAKYG